MVVRLLVRAEWRPRRDYGSLFRATVLLAFATVLNNSAQCASFSPLGLGNGASAVSPQALSKTRVFDPAAGQFYSMLSYGAMSVIAPIMYGGFTPPLALSSNFGLSAAAPMAQTQGFDPAVSAVLDSMLQLGLLPGGGPAEAEAFGVDSSGGAGISLSGSAVLGSNGAVVGSSGSVVGSSGSVVGLSGAAGTLPIISTATGIQPMCTDSAEAKKLQVGGVFWNGQAVSNTPVQFPQGVFSRGGVGNPLGGLVPSGSPIKLSPTGSAGSWCRAGPGPFSQSSPLENHIFWIIVGILVVGVSVFWLSRGMKMPGRSFERSSPPLNRRQIWQH